MPQPALLPKKPLMLSASTVSLGPWGHSLAYFSDTNFWLRLRKKSYNKL